MALNLVTSGNRAVGTEITPEERQLKNERKRIESMIRSYQRNPKNYNAQMEASLERMATQYGIPFKREVPEANIAQKGGAFIGGVVDSVLLDFIPDDWYSSESTNSAKNWGKGVGTVGMIAGTLGAGAGAKALAAGARSIGGKVAGKVAGKQVARKTAREAAEEAAKKSKLGPAGKVLDDAGLEDDILNPPIKDPGAPSKVGQKFDDMDPEQIKSMASSIGDGIETAASKAGMTGPGFLAGFGKESIKKGVRDIGLVKGWNWAKKSLVDDLVKAADSANPGDITKLLGDTRLSAKEIGKVAKALKNTHGNNAFSKSIIAELKGAGSSIGGSVDDIKAFVNSIKNTKNVTAKNIEKIGKSAKLSKEQIKEITDNLINNGIDNFSDAKKFLIASTKTPSIDILKAAQNKDLWMGIGASAAATRPITGIGFGEGLTQTYDDKLEEMYDPMNTVSG